MNNYEVINMPKKATEAATQQPKFRLSVLKENAYRLFGVSTSTFAGATFDLDPKGEYTVAEVKKIIADWLKKEVM